jgi:hypothetical protein
MAVESEMVHILSAISPRPREVLVEARHKRFVAIEVRPCLDSVLMECMSPGSCRALYGIESPDVSSGPRCNFG